MFSANHFKMVSAFSQSLNPINKSLPFPLAGSYGLPFTEAELY